MKEKKEINGGKMRPAGRSSIISLSNNFLSFSFQRDKKRTEIDWIEKIWLMTFLFIKKEKLERSVTRILFFSLMCDLRIVPSLFFFEKERESVSFCLFDHQDVIYQLIEINWWHHDQRYDRSAFHFHFFLNVGLLLIIPWANIKKWNERIPFQKKEETLSMAVPFFSFNWPSCLFFSFLWKGIEYVLNLIFSFNVFFGSSRFPFFHLKAGPRRRTQKKKWKEVLDEAFFLLIWASSTSTSFHSTYSFQEIFDRPFLFIILL